MKKGQRNAGSGGNEDGGEAASAALAPLAEEARRRYINYALSVITSRALPDVRDGLKPVQRRILFGMYNDFHLTKDAKYRKCAEVVGQVMGAYHPHGDSAIYEAMVRMAQDFSLRYPLIEGHGNFGSLDGDAAAAMRYTECRLEGIADDLLRELDSETVPMRPNYVGRQNEPVVIPARVPQLLMNGTTGIAVGMATNIPPHNLVELVEALKALIHDPSLETKDLLKHVKGPDFPTGGQMLNNKRELKEIYETGQGSVRVRGEWELEDLKRGGQQIVITSIPYTVNKSTLVSKIGELVRERKLPVLLDVRDESTQDIRIVLELKRDAGPELVMAYLYKHTSLQTNFNVNMTCLVPTENPEVGAPQRLDLKAMLQHFLDFRFQVVTKRFEYELAKIKARLHILDGFATAYDALDEIIRLIRKSEGKQDAAEKLRARFKFSEEQADAILEMKLYRLAKLEILVIENERKEKRAEEKRLEDLLKHPKKRWGVVQSELTAIAEKYGDKRRTKVGGVGEEVEYTEDAFIADEDARVILTKDGWVKRVREVKDPASTRLREGDEVVAILEGSLKANLVFFSNFGTAYVTRFNDVPASTGYGDPVQKLFKFDDNERVVGALSLDARLPIPETLLAVSKHGFGLRFALAPHKELSTRSGRRFARPGEGDELIGVQPAGEKDLLAVVSESSHALVCKVEEVNELSGPGRGVTVLKVPEGDRVVSFLVHGPKAKDASLTFEMQKGKPLTFQPLKYGVSGRGGKGHELAKRDTVKQAVMSLSWLKLPESEKKD
jgi:DNA gyrase subunit A